MIDALLVTAWQLFKIIDNTTVASEFNAIIFNKYCKTFIFIEKQFNNKPCKAEESENIVLDFNKKKIRLNIIDQDIKYPTTHSSFLLLIPPTLPEEHTKANFSNGASI